MLVALGVAILSWSTSTQSTLCWKSIDVFGSEMVVDMTISKFDVPKSRLKQKGDSLLLDGKPVWLYSVDSRQPRTRVDSITLNIDDVKIGLPKELLVGLYEVNVSPAYDYSATGKAIPTSKRIEFNGNIWLGQDRKSWHVYFSCGDGGVAFHVYLKGTLGNTKVDRYDYRESFLAGKFSATLAKL